MSINLSTRDLSQVHNPSLRLNKNLKNGQNVAFTGNALATTCEFLDKATGKVEILKIGEKLGKILHSPKLHKVFELASNNNGLFSAIAGAAFACFLRPATIMSLPGKDKEDKLYASGHSIASGAIGFIASMVLLNPIASAFKKIEKNPAKFLKEGASYLGVFNDGIGKEAAFKAAKKITNLGFDTMVAIPRALVTIAVIPLVLKYVFGLDKKGSGKPQPNNPGSILQNYAAINFQANSIKELPALQKFMGGAK